VTVSSWTEWDPLEEVVVGTVTGAVYPEHGPILAANGEPDWLWHFQGAFMEDELIDGANAQLNALIELLEGEGVRVARPDPIPHNVGYETPFWSCKSGWNTANPRDLFLVVGDEIIECASPLRHRHFESLAYKRMFTEYFRQGARLTSAPRPALRDQLYDPSFLTEPRPEPATNEERTLHDDEVHRYPITEDEPVFEAADFFRCGEDLFVTRSVVTNELGVEWVRRHLGPDMRVHLVETRCKAPWHIDTTLLPLAPGKLLANPAWLREVPEALRSWDIIWAPEPTYAEDSPMAHPYFSSQWVSMNVLSLDEERVIVDDQQTALIAALEQSGFTPIPLAFDHVGAFGGSFHCVTLDVRRRGERARYC
jgi:glycine amidinotransferase